MTLLVRVLVQYSWILVDILVLLLVQYSEYTRAPTRAPTRVLLVLYSYTHAYTVCNALVLYLCVLALHSSQLDGLAQAAPPQITALVLSTQASKRHICTSFSGYETFTKWSQVPLLSFFAFFLCWNQIWWSGSIDLTRNQPPKTMEPLISVNPDPGHLQTLQWMGLQSLCWQCAQCLCKCLQAHHGSNNAQTVICVVV